MNGDPWFACLADCEAQVPCVGAQHTVRWEAGSLRLLEHADPEGELVLAALGGQKARCVQVAEAWGRHTDDLSVLRVGPRDPGDPVAVGWDDIEAAEEAPQPMAGRPFRPGMMRPGGAPGAAGPPGAAGRRHPRMAVGRGGILPQGRQQEMEAQRVRRLDLLMLLALGYPFQVRLAGHVAAAWADRLADPQSGLAAGSSAGSQAAPQAVRVRSSLIAAISGRLATAVEAWLGLEPRQLAVTLHSGPGWGSVELTGSGRDRQLRVSLPADWLARVWASDLTLTAGHLVVAVDRTGWPDARVLALRAPGTEPVVLDVHARGGDAPHWEI